MRTIGTLPLQGPSREPVNFRRALASHGVVTLAPNTVDLERCTLQTTVQLEGGAHTLLIAPTGGAAATAEVQSTTAPRSKRTRERLLDVASHLLRLDEDLSAFYARAAKDRKLSWVTLGAGRMLRSQTVFEDVVKTICTTNCAWSATVRMTDALVGTLGAQAPGAGGGRAFPTAAAMAQAGDEFYAQVARTGYRGAYLSSLAHDVADGNLDLEELNDRDLPDEEVERRLLALPGVGPYAAAHVMLTALGRYHRLILDSWTRPTYAELNGGRAVADAVIIRRFRRFGPYAGLAFWLMLTDDWVEQ